jgi:hypothetical protein
MGNILDLIRPETAFDPETVALLVAAFDEAWDRLCQSGSECARPAYARAMREVAARRIIEMRQRGIVNKKELVDGAVRFLATNYRHGTNELGPKGLCGAVITCGSSETLPAEDAARAAPPPT